jgi:hypothetical protein
MPPLSTTLLREAIFSGGMLLAASSSVMAVDGDHRHYPGSQDSVIQTQDQIIEIFQVLSPVAGANKFSPARHVGALHAAPVEIARDEPIRPQPIQLLRSMIKIEIVHPACHA